MQKKLHFDKSGTGNRILIAFHGFGQTNRAFQQIAFHFREDYTIYSFDLYYHGRSSRKDLYLMPDEWKKDFQEFLNEEEITRFSLVAFSLGGRFALVTTKFFPGLIDKLILIAPDGIYRNFWFLFSTSRLGNPIFRYMMFNPKRFEMLLGYFEKWRLTSPSMIRFARRELADVENCHRVYRSWTYFRPLQLSPRQLTKVLNSSRIETHLILGEYDYIIPKKEIFPKLEKVSRLKSHILPLKHHHLIDGSIPLLKNIL